MNVKKRKKYSIILLFFCLGAVYGAVPNPMLGMRVSTGSTPKIDGIISPGEWDDAAKLPPFFKVETGSPVWDKLNEVMLKYDSENFYIGFRTYMAIDMNLAPQQNDSQSMSEVESFDIRLIVAGQPKWRRFMVERSGAKFDQLIRGHIHDNPQNWNPEWTYRSRLLPQDFAAWSIWEGEIAIPWKVLEIDAPQEPRQLSGMFIRNLGNSATAEGNRIASWNLASSKVDLIFDANYGALVFEPEKPVFRVDAVKTYSRCQAALSGQMTGPGAEKGGIVNSAVWDSGNSKRSFDFTTENFKSATVNWKKNIDVKQAEKATGRIFVSDAAGQIVCKYPFRTLILPAFYSDALWNSQHDTVNFYGESLKGFQPGDRIRFTLSAQDGREYISQTIRAEHLKNAFDFQLDASGIPEGKTFIATSALMRQNKVVNESRFEIKKEFPVWRGTAKKYQVTAPPPGWEKMKTEKDSTGRFLFKFRDNAYLFGSHVLPETILLRGEKFSAQSWNFIAETSGGIQKFTSKSMMKTDENDRGVTLHYSGESQELRLDAKIRIEFDGLAWYECRFTPKAKQITVKRLSIECPMVPEKLRYMRSFAFSTAFSTASRYALIAGAKRPDGPELPEISISGGISFDGWKFNDTFNHFYWIGGEDRGCLWILPSLKNISIDKTYNKVEDSPGKFGFNLELVNKPVVWNQPVDYQFGIALMPTRRPPDPAGLRRVGQFANGLTVGEEHRRALTIDDQYYTREPISWRFFRPEKGFEIPKDFFFGDMIASWIMRDVQDGNFMPDPKTRDEIRREARGIREGHHGKPILWYDMLATPSANSPRDEWRSGPYTDLLGDVPVILTCAAASWPDAWLYGVQERIKDGVAGFYLDLSGWRTCSNRLHGCGYYDEKGKLEPTLPFLAQREFMLTLQKMIKENDPEGIIIYHGSSPMTQWTDFHIDAESWQYANDYRTFSPEYYQLLMFNTKQTGSQGCFYSVLLYSHVPGAQKSKATQEDALGLALIHGMHCFNIHALEIYGNYITTKPLLDFGVDAADSEWIPYWRNPLSQYPAGPVAVSSWKRGDRELAVIFNTAYAPAAFDFGGRKAVDRLKKGGVLSGKLELPPRSLQIVEFGAK